MRAPKRVVARRNGVDVDPADAAVVPVDVAVRAQEAAREAAQAKAAANRPRPAPKARQPERVVAMGEKGSRADAPGAARGGGRARERRTVVKADPVHRVRRDLRVHPSLQTNAESSLGYASGSVGVCRP